MEEVISNSHGAGLLIVNSDPIILNDGRSFGSLLNGNGNLLQGALNLLEPAPKSVADSLKLNLVNGDVGKEGDGRCIIVDGPVKLDGGNIIQLSIEDLNKIGLQLSFDNGESNCNVVKTREETVGGELFLSSLNANKEKLFLSAPDPIARAQLEPHLSLNVSQPLNIANFGSVLDENALKGLTFQQLEVVTPLDNENMTYTLQLDGGSGGLINSAAGLTPVTTNVTTANDRLIVSSIADDTTKKISLADQLKPDNKYSPMFRINSKAGVDLKPKAFVKTNLNGIQNSLNSKVNDDKSKLVKVSKGQSLIVKNRNSSPNVKLNPTNINSLNNKTKRICILNKNVSGVPTMEKTETSQKMLKISADTLVNKTESKSISLGGGDFNSHHVRLSGKVESPVPTSSSNQDTSSKPNKFKRLSSAQLEQIAAYLQKNRDDQGMITNPSTFYDTETNTKIICRVVYPEDFENGKNLKKTKSPTKPKVEKDTAVNDTEVLTLLSFSRTRSGRLSRPPRHIAVGQTSANSTSDKPATTQTDIPDIMEPVIGVDNVVNKASTSVNPKSKPPPKENGLPKKGVSWKKKIKVKNGTKTAPLSEVLGKYSELEIKEVIKNKIADLPLLQCLLLKVSSSTDKDKVRLLCDELTSFAKSMAAAADQFLKPMSPETADSSIMLKNEALCALFNKSMGVYSSDSDALMKFYCDKRKREEEKDSQSYKKSKSEFVMKKEATTSDQFKVKNEESVDLKTSNNAIKESLDLDLGESVDDLVNQRLESLQVNLVPTMVKPLADDLISNLLSPSEDKKIDKVETARTIIKTKIDMCSNKKGGKSPSKYSCKTINEVKGTIDLDLGESVDELVNARLASLGDEIVPSLPSRALGDDVLVGLLNDTSNSLFQSADKTVNTTASSRLIPDVVHSTSSLFSLEKDVTVSSSRSILSDGQTVSADALFSSIDKRQSPVLSDTQSSTDLFPSIEKRISPSNNMLEDQSSSSSSSSSLFSSLNKSFPTAPGSEMLVDAPSSTNVFPNINKCITSSGKPATFAPIEKRVASSSQSLLTTTRGIFSSIEPSPISSTSVKRSTSSRSLLRSSQNMSLMPPPIEKTVSQRSLLTDTVKSSTTHFLSADKQVTSTSSLKPMVNSVQTVSSTSDLFPSMQKRVSPSTEDLIKSLENLSAEIPAPSSASLQDFSLFSQHFSRESKTAI